MIHLSHCFAVSAAASLLVGQWLGSVGSAHAAEPPSVAADLVPLAIAIPDAVSRLKILDAELNRVTQLSRVITRTEVERVRIEREAAQQKLELLRMMVQAELDVTVARNAVARARRDRHTDETRLVERAAELRAALLKHMLKFTQVDAPQAEDNETTDEQARAGRFSGIVTVNGEVPDLPPLLQPGDPIARRLANGEVLLRAAEEIPDESLLVGPDGGLAKVFVFMEEAPAEREFPVPEPPIVLTSRNSRFHPRCAIVRVGQDIQLNNHDAVVNNMHFMPARNEAWNMAIMPNETNGPKLRFVRPEPQPIRVLDDIHPWKSAYQIVVDHPFATLTDETGKFRIDGLPPGEHVFRFWHERAGFLERAYPVTIREGEAPEVNITVEAEQLLEDRRSR